MNRKALLALLLLLLPVLLLAQSKPGIVVQRHEAPRPKWAIAIHGDAGTIPKTMPEAKKQEYLRSLNQALKTGKEVLQQGGTSLDAVEKVIRFLEDDPLFNAGKGAVYTHEGTHELDAAIMDGRDLSCGSVAALKTVKNPISLATGIGEEFIKHTVSHDISALMEYKGLSLQAAMDQVIHHKLKPGDGGVIGVAHDGSLALVLSSEGMYRGAADSNGRFEVRIWE